MRPTWKWILVFGVLGLTLVGFDGPQISYALTLQEAKSQGLLGEAPDGYLGLVSPTASSAVKSLMNTVNQKRKQKYQETAQRTGAQLRDTEALFGEALIKKTKPGHYIKLSGKWVKR